MKIHRVLVDQITQALKEIFSSTRHADKVIEYYLKNNRKWGARDRRFFAENVYDLVRFWRRQWNLAGFPDAAYRDGEAMSLSQIRRVWAVYWLQKNQEKLEEPEFEGLDLSMIEARKSQITNPAILHSFSDEIFELGMKEWKDEWLSLAASLNKQAEVFLRVNTLKTDKEKLLQTLKAEEVITESLADFPSALRLSKRKNVFATEAFKKGLFEVQDIGSQKIAPLLRPEPGMRVIDACAGAGGKTLHLAALMKNKGRIISMDVHERKLEELKKRVRRNGIDIVETRWIENSKVIKRLEESADRVLLDVPCSGLGVLKRNPDTKWKLKLSDIERLKDLQKQILRDYSKMTKVGGSLVYATCSLLPSENTEQVKNFLEHHSDQWELQEELFLRPDQYEGDAFYAALLHKKVRKHN